MPDHLKRFERLAYASLVPDCLSALLFDSGDGVAIVVCELVLIAIVGVLIWAAARAGQVWAVGVIALFAVFGLFPMVGDFWVGGPAWLQNVLKPDHVVTPFEKILDVVSEIMILVALWFYVVGKTGRESAVASTRR